MLSVASCGLITGIHLCLSRLTRSACFGNFNAWWVGGSVCRGTAYFTKGEIYAWDTAQVLKVPHALLWYCWRCASTEDAFSTLCWPSTVPFRGTDRRAFDEGKKHDLLRSYRCGTIDICCYGFESVLSTRVRSFPWTATNRSTNMFRMYFVTFRCHCLITPIAMGSQSENYGRRMAGGDRGDADLDVGSRSRAARRNVLGVPRVWFKTWGSPRGEKAILFLFYRRVRKTVVEWHTIIILLVITILCKFARQRQDNGCVRKSNACAAHRNLRTKGRPLASALQCTHTTNSNIRRRGTRQTFFYPN